MVFLIFLLSCSYFAEIMTAGYTEEFKVNKKFSVQALRTCGFGSKVAEMKITREVEELVQYIKQRDGQELSLRNPFRNVCANAISSVVLGKRFAWDDPQLTEFITGIRGLILSIQEATAYGWLGTYVPHFILHFFCQETERRIIENAKPIREYMKTEIQKHKNTFSKSDLRDFLDHYLAYKSTDQNFTDDQLADSILAFMIDAIDTLGGTMEWVFKVDGKV